jgi:hypothetical protein
VLLVPATRVIVKLLVKLRQIGKQLAGASGQIGKRIRPRTFVVPRLVQKRCTKFVKDQPYVTVCRFCQADVIEASEVGLCTTQKRRIREGGRPEPLFYGLVRKLSVEGRVLVEAMEQLPGHIVVEERFHIRSVGEPQKAIKIILECGIGDEGGPP